MNQLRLTEHDRRYLSSRGIQEDEVHSQIATLIHGIPPLNIHRPCTIGDGIIAIPERDHDELTQRFDEAAAAGRVSTFIPASGAASRMFTSLLSAYHRTETSPPREKGHHDRPEDSDLRQCFQFLREAKTFAFFDELAGALQRNGLDFDTLRSTGRHHVILEYLLFQKGLNYANHPKGLIPFHRYPGRSRTPVEEHLVEAMAYARDSQNVARIHFTVSSEHQEAMAAHVQDVQRRYERRRGTFDVSLSTQKPSTDTIAVDRDNHPVRDRAGNLVFRQSGHGALLENLNDLHADMVFLKNIDNVVPDRLKGETFRTMKQLGGYLLTIHQTLFSYLTQLADGDGHGVILDQAFEWAERTLMIRVPPTVRHASRQRRTTFLVDRLNRPLRVCGMVRDAQASGGGPFWVQQDDGTCTLQIVEVAQCDAGSAEQQAILKASTHFNPVIMVCSVRDSRGRPFDLTQFRDPHAGIITTKSYAGRPIKALERPGLWNGGMAHWNTVFVEIPSITFNPVKTVLDLLRPEHQ